MINATVRKVKPVRVSRRPNAPFAMGVLPFVPYVGTMPFTAADEAELVAANSEPAVKPMPIRPSELAAQIKADLARCRELGRQYDALLNPLPPLSGGAPRFVPSEQDLADFHAAGRDFDDRMDYMLAVGACG
jgi:hypothetical protein